MQRIAQINSDNRSGPRSSRMIERRLAALAEGLVEGEAFEIRLPQTAPLRVGTGEPAFRVAVRNEQGLSALKSLDEARVGEAYLNGDIDGDIDLEGDLVAALNMRRKLTDNHPLLYLWSTYGQRLLFGQVRRDKKWIAEHYDTESDFYLMFLDKQARCYSHGYFENDEEPLESAI